MWFGEPWPSADERAPICEDDSQRVPTPVGEACAFCDDEIRETDRGGFVNALVDGPGGWPEPRRSPVHNECSLREVLGGAGHLAAEPHAAGTCDPDAGLTRHQSAILVQRWVEWMGVDNMSRASRFQQVREKLLRDIEEARAGKR